MTRKKKPKTEQGVTVKTILHTFSAIVPQTDPFTPLQNQGLSNKV